MKRLIAVILILSVVFVFAACAKEPVEESNTTEPANDAVTQEDATFAAETTTEKTEATTAQTTTKAPETTTKAPETTTKAPATTTKAPETTTKAPVQKSASAIASTVAGTGMFEETLVNLPSSTALRVFGISSSIVADAAYYAGTAAVAEEVLVIRVNNAGDVAAVKSAMETRRANQISDYADYVAKEVPKLQSAVLYTSGNYVVFCVSNNNSAIKSVIANQF